MMSGFRIFLHRSFMKLILMVLLNCSVYIFPQLINEFTISDNGAAPSINHDMNGGIYVVWQNLEDAVYMKHFGADGNIIGEEVKFANTSASTTPRVAANANYTVTVWEDRESNIITYYNSYIVGNIRSISNLSANYYVTFNDSYMDTYRNLPDAGFLNDTSFIVVWCGGGIATRSKYGIYGQIASVNGEKIGGNFLISDSSKVNFDCIYPRIITGNNSFFVTWEDQSSGHYNLFGRIFKNDGTPAGPGFLISDDTAMTYMFYYGIAKDISGNIVIVWIADKGKQSQIEWRWYKNDGTPLTDVEQLTQLDTLFNSGRSIDISIDESGKIIVEWEQLAAEIPVKTYKIIGQRYNADKSKLGSRFWISPDSSENDQLYPNVFLKDNKIFSVWGELGSIDWKGIKGNILEFDKISSIEKQKTGNGKINSFKLYPNYPNPFNPSTTILYEMPRAGFVSLKVYDALGREVAELVNGHKQQGRYNINFDASKLASGIYFYQIRVADPSNSSNNFISTRKMILVK